MNKRFKMFEVCVLAIYITITTAAPIESHRNPPSYSAIASSNFTRAEQKWHGDWWIIFRKKNYIRKIETPENLTVVQGYG